MLIASSFTASADNIDVNNQGGGIRWGKAIDYTINDFMDYVPED